MAIEKTKQMLDNLMEFLKSYINKNKYPPTVREICSALGFKSTATAQYYLNKLDNMGMIKRSSAKNRAMELCNEYAQGTRVITVPVLGNVAAGNPLLTTEECDETFLLPADYFPTRSGNLFMLRVEGQSMMNAGILNGDMVLISQQNTANNGDIIVAMIDGEVTLKRFYKYPNYIRLKPENNNFQDIIVYPDRDFVVLGKAVGLMRSTII